MITTSPAKWAGTCCECAGRFEVGDEIIRIVEGYAHAKCDLSLDVIGEVCTTCWIAKSVSGACGC